MKHLKEIPTGAFEEGPLGQRLRDVLTAVPNVSQHDLVPVIVEANNAGFFDPPDVGFFFVALHLVRMGENEIVDHPEIVAISDEIQVVIKEHDAPYGEDGWPSGEGPVEYLNLQEKWAAVADRIIAHKMREYDPTMAALFTSNRREFDRRYEVGRFDVMGPLTFDTDEDEERR